MLNFRLVFQQPLNPKVSINMTWNLPSTLAWSLESSPPRWMFVLLCGVFECFGPVTTWRVKKLWLGSGSTVAAKALRRCWMSWRMTPTRWSMLACPCWLLGSRSKHVDFAIFGRKLYYDVCESTWKRRFLKRLERCSAGQMPMCFCFQQSLKKPN